MKRESSGQISGRIRKRHRNRYLVKFGAAFLFIMITGSGTGSIFSYANARLHGSGPEESSFKYYTSIRIAEGSSLHTIAEEYISEEYGDIDSYIDEVMQMNALDDETVHAGQFLIIPYYSDSVK